MSASSSALRPGALRGLRVLELGQFLAGPFCGFMLAGFGAEVIKVEPPGDGDPLRRWRAMDGDTSLWWRSLARDKRCITCNLKHPEGRALLRRLLASGVDIVIENFRPGVMERWGLGYEDLRAIDPRIVLVRISGFGQTGPLAARPGFANIAEAFGGLRYVTGVPGGPPMRCGVSLADSLAGLHAAYGALAAIHERDVVGSGEGQVVDVALYEAVLNMMESLLPEADLLGHVRQPSGSSIPGVVPSNSYRCRDGRFIAIGANSVRTWEALMRCVGRADMADDPSLRHNDGRVPRQAEIDAAIEAWTSAQEADTALVELEAAGVPASAILDARQLLEHPHVQARGMTPDLPLPDGRRLRVPGCVPTLSRTPPHSARLGPALGADNEVVYGERLGLAPEDVADLRTRGVL